MSQFSTVFKQLLHMLPQKDFQMIVRQYHADKYAKYFTAWCLLSTILFSQIKRKDSLRDVVIAFNQHQKEFQHLGIPKVIRSTLADANNRINYRVYETLFYKLYDQCQDYTPKHKFKFKNPLFALDSSTIDLCLSMFEWAKFRRRKGGIKLHCLLNLSGHIPAFIVIKEAKPSDVKIAQETDFKLMPDSIIVFDRGYVDFKLFRGYTQQEIWFVTRAKKNMQYAVVGQQTISEHKKGLLYDQTIKLTGVNQNKNYPQKLRIIGYKDPDTGKEYQFLTNNFKLAAYTITQIYKARWEVELFFKWIKQHLKVKTFLGTSKNAVLSQIWIAMCYFLMLAYIRYQTKYKGSMLTLSRIFDEALFSRIHWVNLLSLKLEDLARIRDSTMKLPFFV